jgi:hypothetical protein
MTIKYIPFGGGARYMSVLAGPLAIFVLIVNNRRFDYKELWSEGLRFVTPFIPLVLGLGFFVLYHGQDIEFNAVLTRPLYALLIYLAARELGLSEKHLIYTACVAAFVFLVVSLYDVFLIKRFRAFGGTYENRFAQLSLIVFGLSGIYILKVRSNVINIFNIILLLSMIGALYAVFLTQSRGPLLIIPLLFIFFVRRYWISRTFTIGSLIFISVLGIFILWENPVYFERVKLAVEEAISFLHGNHDSSSVGIRLELWKIAFGTVSFERLFGLGRLSFNEISHIIPELSISAINVSNHFPMDGGIYPWRYHGDIPQLIGFGGIFLFLSYAVTIFLLFKRSAGNLYLIWLVSCLLIFGLSELVVLNKYGFTLFISCWALYCAAQDRGLRLRSRIGDKV